MLKYTILIICILELKSIYCFRKSNIIRCPSYPNINKIYNYTFSFDNINTIKYDNYKYIINDKKVDLENYSVNTRSKINRGFKKLAVKKVSKNELINEGYNVYLNAIKRYNVVLNKISKKDFLDDNIENI